MSADGQFDSGASVPAGAVHSGRLSEGKKSYVSLYYIVFMYRRHWTDDVCAAVLFLFHAYRCNGMQVCRGGSGAGSLGGAQQLTGGGGSSRNFP